MLRRISWQCEYLCVIRLGILRFDDTAGAEPRRLAQIDVQETSINRFLTTPTGHPEAALSHATCSSASLESATVKVLPLSAMLRGSG